MERASATVDTLTAALVEANDQVVALTELASFRAGSLDAEEAVGRLLRDAMRLLNADAVAAVGPALEAVVGDDAGALVEIGHRALDAETSGQFDADDRHHLVVPVGSDDACVLLFARDRARFATGHRRIAEAVASAVGATLTTAALHRQALMASEHRTAARLAQAVLPSGQPATPLLDAHLQTFPARDAGGDLFAYRSEPEALHFVVGDVSGKGLPAALVMTNVVSAANAAFERVAGAGPVAMARAIDETVYDYLSDAGLFVTLVVGTIRTKEQTMALANCGHSPIDAAIGATMQPVPAGMPPIGVLPGLDCELWESEFRPGDLLVVGSDGLTEQEDPAGEQFGEGRLRDLVLAERLNPAEQIHTEVFAAIDAWAQGASQVDDRTLMVVRR